MLRKIPLLIFILFCCAFYSQNNTDSALDSVNKYREIYKTIPFPKKAVISLEKALFFAKKLKNDSLLINIYADLAYENVLLNDKKNFEKVNNSLLKIYQNKNDSTALGFYYQNKGWFYKNNGHIDSSYYYYNKTKNISKASKDTRLKEVYLDLLLINFSASDYLGTEELAIEIIDSDYLKTEYEILATTYSFLGVVSIRLRNYKNAIRYNQKALEIIEKIKDEKIKEEKKFKHINDISLMYAKQENFEKALFYNNKISDMYPNLKQNNLEGYAGLILNRGFCEFNLGKINDAIKHFNEALKIGEELNLYYLQTYAFLKLATLYKKEKNSKKAKLYVDKALVLAKKINFRKLETLKLSAEIYSGKKSIEFYKKYISLKEEIEIKEQEKKNKFVRVRFETQKKEEENTFLKQQTLIAKEKIKNEQNKNRIISLIALVSFLLALFIFFFYKSRQKILSYKANLGKAQAREQERQEIAASLHDKVVGDLQIIYQRALKNNTDNIAEPLSKINTEIRNLSHKLGSVDFNEVTFKDQLINLVSDYFKPTFKIKLKNLEKIDWTLIEPQIKRTLYLIIREAIQNSKKHAFASEIIIDFKDIQNNIQVTIKDNGKGFCLKTTKFGLGLRNQKKRVAELNGSFTIESVMNLGTTTIVEMPLKA